MEQVASLDVCAEDESGPLLPSQAAQLPAAFPRWQRALGGAWALASLGLLAVVGFNPTVSSRLRSGPASPRTNEGSFSEAWERPNMNKSELRKSDILSTLPMEEITRGLSLSGVNLGGWLNLEDWFFSGSAGRNVMTLQSAGQG
ncbi:unnamed protein product, partial [Polarella glacialis]